MRILNLLKIASLTGALAVQSWVRRDCGASRFPSGPAGRGRCSCRSRGWSPCRKRNGPTSTRNATARSCPPRARPGNGFRTLLNVPELVDHTMSFYRYVSQGSSLPPRIRELLMLRTAWLHGSDVIWRERVPSARKAGLGNDLSRIAEGPVGRRGGIRLKQTCFAWPISCSGIRS